MDPLSLGVGFGLLWFYGPVLVGQWPLLLIAAAGASLVTVYAGSFQILTADGVVVLAVFGLGLAGLSRRTAQPAFCAVALLMLAQETTLAGSVESVFLRIGGTDALTYESFAHEILDTWSLQGGEDVFYYQPLFRYIRFLQHLLLGDGDLLLAAFARSLVVVSTLWMIWKFRVGGTVSTVASVASLALLAGLLNSIFIADLIRQGHTEYPPLVALPVFFSLLFVPRATPSSLGASLVAVALIARINQAPALLWLLGCHLWTLLRSHRREAVRACAVVALIGLMPAAHNLYYGGELVFTTTSIAVPENLVVLPADPERTTDELMSRMVGQLGAVLYDTAAGQRHPQDGGGLQPVFRGLQLLWLLAILSVFVSRSPRIAGRRGSARLEYWRPRGLVDLHHFAIPLSPITFLAPHLVYSALPRYIVIAYVAMAAAALYAVGVARPSLQAAPGAVRSR